MTEVVTNSALVDGRHEPPRSEAKSQGIVQRLFGSLAFKVGAAVIVTEVLVLAALGIPLIQQRDEDIDRRAVERTLIPGKLLQAGLLSYASVADRRIMTELLGEELIDGMVVGGNGNVFYSLDPGHLGKDVGALPGIDPAWFDPSHTEPQLIETRGEGETFLISITPLFTLDSKAPSLFAYIKTNTTKLTENKAAWRRLIYIGTLAVVLTTSLIIFISFQLLIFRRIVRSAEFVERVREGDLETLLAEPGSDEFGTLERGMNEMVVNIKRRRAQRDAMEADLALSEERYAFAVSGTADGLWDWNIVTGEDYLSPRWKEILGYQDHEIENRHEVFTSAIHPDDRDQVVEAVRAHLEDRLTYDSEYRMRCKDGSYIWILAKGQAVWDEAGTALRMAGTISDITERKRAEQEIRKLNEDLERRVEERTADLRAAQDTLIRNERLSTLGQLIATVSHELRNPLGVIRTSAFTLQNELTDGTPIMVRALERIERTVVRCDRIIDELLDFTRISQLEPEPTPLDVWLEETLNEQTLSSGVALRLELHMPDTVVSFDHDRFRRAVINVFDNACQAMIGKYLEDAGSEQHILVVRTQAHDGRVEVIFEDTGTGMPLDVQKRIFEPLYSTKGFGVGLGLPVVKHIMEQHDGGIEVESEEGRGTRVCLWLPHGHSTH